jgi:formyl-CoA transferase/CoA:oxalate CoA-transferase
MILGDLGAEVIKVEKLITGDDTRCWGPPFVNGESSYFLCINRNKKSLALNIENQMGRKIVYELARKCDVFLENFRPGVTEKLEIDYKTIHSINPRIIYCSISGFGQTGPYWDRPAYDIVIQGMSGLMGVTGESGKPPVRIGVAITDIGAGMYAAIAILAALRAREKTGEGQWVDVSLNDSAISWMTYMAANYFATGKVPERMGSAHPSIVPYQCFEAGDGRYFTLAVGNDGIWRNFCKALDSEELARNPKFTTNPRRVENRNELVRRLAKIFLTKARDEWIKILLKEKIPCGPVYTTDEIFVDPQVLHRNMLVEIEHPRADKIKQIGIPIKFSETTGEIRTPPPLLGEHTEEVLRDILGYSTEKINQLREEGLI